MNQIIIVITVLILLIACLLNEMMRHSFEFRSSSRTAGIRGYGETKQVSIFDSFKYKNSLIRKMIQLSGKQINQEEQIKISNYINTLNRGNDIDIIKHVIKNKLSNIYVPPHLREKRDPAVRYANKLKYLKEWVSELPDNAKIVDHGAGRGDISAEIGKHYDRPISVLEIYEPPELADSVNLVLVDKKTNKIDLPDNSVDLCTSFMVFHHIEHIDLALSELARVLKSGSYLYVQEHAFDDDIYHEKFLNLLHIVYSLMADENETKGIAVSDRLTDEKFTDIGYTRYFTKDALINLLAKYGFKYIKSEDIIGLQKQYFALFQLN